MTQLRILPGIDPDELIAEAKVEHDPVATVCLFSGGNDSLATAHRCREHYESLVFIDTGTALPGVVDWVHEAAEWLDKPVRVYAAPEGAYRRIVLGGNTRPDGTASTGLGFPGPMAHGRCYVDLKERQLEAMKRDLKVGHPRSARVLALTGLRRGESQRRSKRDPLTRRGSLAFVNPLIDWTNAELHDYRREHDLPQSDVAAILHRSGECMCLAFGTPDEAAMIRALFPDWWEQTIAPLEAEADRLGLKCNRWGYGRECMGPAEGELPVGAICEGCEQLALSSGGGDDAA